MPIPLNYDSFHKFLVSLGLLMSVMTVFALVFLFLEFPEVLDKFVYLYFILITCGGILLLMGGIGWNRRQIQLDRYLELKVDFQEVETRIKQKDGEYILASMRVKTLNLENLDDHIYQQKLDVLDQGRREE